MTRGVALPLAARRPSDIVRVTRRRSTTAESGYTSLRDRVAPARPERPAFSGPLIVLVGPAVTGAVEICLLALRQVPGCVLVGERTAGAPGTAPVHRLGHGLRLAVPERQVFDPDGRPVLGRGIEPDRHVAWESPTPERPDYDPVLHRAVVIALGTL